MIYQLIITILSFLLVKWIVWQITEKRLVPEFLQYEPYICYKCCGFWLCIGLFISVGIIYHLWLFMGLGCLITALDAIALHIHEKKMMDIGNKMLNE